MNNNEIEQLIILIGERFYEYVEKHDGKFVEKILHYHGISTYTILTQVSQHEVIDFSEKLNDEDFINELI